MRIVIAVGIMALASLAAAQGPGYEQAKEALDECALSAIGGYSALDRPLPERADMVVTQCGPALDEVVGVITHDFSGEDKRGARDAAIEAFRDWVSVRLADAKVDDADLTVAHRRSGNPRAILGRHPCPFQ